MNEAQKKREKARNLFKVNNLTEAAKLYSDLCNHDPDYESYYMLGVIYSMSSNHAIAEKHLIESLRHNSQSEATWGQLGITQASLGKFESALESLKKSVSLNPNNIQSLNNLGNLYRELGKLTEAISSYQASLSINRKDPIALNNLANIYLTQCQYDKAEKLYKEAIKRNKSYFDAYYNLGATYQSKGEYKLALNYYKRAQKLNPDSIQPISAIANLYEKQGNIEKSLDCLNPLIQAGVITPDIADTFSKICIKKKTYDEGINAINKCLASHINPINEQALRFSLGDIYDKKGLYDDAFKEYRAANQMRPYHYDKLLTENYFGSVKNIFRQLGTDPEFHSNNTSIKPIFIVGMPRSGTSLIEQILNSHSKVAGAGELPYIGEISDQLSSTSHYPDNVVTLDQEQLDTFSNVYLNSLASHGNNTQHITDKMPHNFMYIGLIRLLLPNIKIIHCLRDPLDVCLSIYFHNFNQNHPYSDNLGNLAHYYNQYRDLMNFWHKLYGNLILDVQYEELLTFPEDNIRNLLDHLDLDWDDNCLRYYENKRTVSTPSYEQVRQPMYKTSMQRWRNYSAFIGELKASLDSKYILPPMNTYS